MSKKKHSTDQPRQKFSPSVVNKKARFDYQLLEKLEAGIVLMGSEVKSLRQGKATLNESYARIINGELFLLGCNIATYDHANTLNHNPTRTRKLLVHRREINKLQSKLVQKGLTLVPVRIYFSQGRAKVELALARGKTHFDKREKIKEREIKRDIRQALNRR